MRTTLNLQPYGEAFHHGEVALAQNRVRLRLLVGEGVFSAASVDVGTRLLLRTLAGPDYGTRPRVLDLGCGYGPLGLALAAMAPRTRVDLVDRDSVAVAYSRVNAEINHLGPIAVAAGLGWADLGDDARYDLVVSNIPAKVGPAAVESWLLDGHRFLADDGVIAVVVINRLEEEVNRVLAAAGAEVVLREENREHVALHYRLPVPLPDRGRPGMQIHARGRLPFAVGKLRWQLEGAWGLPEFDSLHHATRLAVRALRDVHKRPNMDAAVAGTGVGHGALALRQTLNPRHVHLVDRDLLALRVSAANLERAGQASGTVSLHQTPICELPPDSVDIVLAVFTVPTPQKVVDAVVASWVPALRTAGRLVLAGTSTAVTRALERVERTRMPLLAVGRAREKGHSAADLVRRPD